jgi:hypothetical protein
MGMIIPMHFDSAVLEANKDVFTQSYIEDDQTIIEFDLRKRDFQKEFNTSSKIYWPKDFYTVDIDEFSTYHNPIRYRFILAQGYYLNDQNKRIYFTPEVKEASTYHHVSNNIIRLSCFLSVVCGVTLRNIALIFSMLFKVSTTKSSIKRWIDEIGDNLPSEEEILKQLLEAKKPTQCHIDGYYPLGTNNCVIVIKDEFDRILITHETKTENYKETKKILEKVKACGLEIVSSFSDYSQSFIQAVKEVYPKAKIQADHFHTVKNIWKHLKNCLLEHRNELKSEAEKKEDKEMLEIASDIWKLRWILLKKPSNLTKEEKEKIEALEKKDGFISKFRSIINQTVNIFDFSNTETQAKMKLKRLEKQIVDMDNNYLKKVSKFLIDHWKEAMQYLKKKGLEKDRRSSNSESGMRILRRLEKNHDGIRSERTRKNYIKIYQAIKYLSIDVATFVKIGPEKLKSNQFP